MILIWSWSRFGPPTYFEKSSQKLMIDAEAVTNWPRVLSSNSLQWVQILTKQFFMSCNQIE